MTVDRLYMSPDEAAAAIGADAEYIRKHRKVFDARRVGRRLFIPVAAVANLPKDDANDDTEQSEETAP